MKFHHKQILKLNLNFFSFFFTFFHCLTWAGLGSRNIKLLRKRVWQFVPIGWSDIFLDPCRNFHCKRGKVCQADEQEKLSCVCQDPAACPPTKDHEHVCGTDNKTYDGTCQLFGTKCKLEGTKMGHQLHLDYMGSCKYIPPCTDYEVDQFPLRMRHWLKNVLMQLYERDLDRSGFLSDKQRSKVKKIYQNEKHLMAGDNPVELLLHDFEKNYHMYVYPVHWQFSQLDRHPANRLLSHSELAPLRASLVPMEHCITRFFQECDADGNKHVSLKEWCHCFGIKEGKAIRLRGRWVGRIAPFQSRQRVSQFIHRS
uniref:SPARC like 1 n=1 Tax=Gopherus evgoodei TaxID=1825980 RepID=A0A8C4VHE0_9SAUR